MEMVGLCAVAVGCGERRDTAPAPHHCSGPQGSVTDLRSLPQYAMVSGPGSWTDRVGCYVRRDVLATYQGPEHCGWQSSRFLSAGIPIGSRSDRAATSARYVRDPENVFGDVATSRGFDPNARLPLTAVDTGFRRDGVVLWAEPGRPDAVYLVGVGVERWPRDLTPEA
jgi:hypothetical protein